MEGVGRRRRRKSWKSMRRGRGSGGKEVRGKGRECRGRRKDEVYNIDRERREKKKKLN